MDTFRGKVSGFIEQVKNKKMLSILGIGILVAAVPLTVFISQQNQDVRQRAAYTNAAPAGYVGEVSCNRIAGWAHVPGYGSPTSVSIGASNMGADYSRTVMANVHWDDGSRGVCGFDCGYSLAVPESWKDGQEHNISAVAINPFTGVSTQLTLAAPTATIKCQGQIEPKGYLVQPACSGADQIYGWACDENNYSAPIDVHIYVDDVYYTAVTANQGRDGSVAGQCGGSDAHWFSLPMPAQFKSGEHRFTAHAINIKADGTAFGNPNPRLLRAGVGDNAAWHVSCPLPVDAQWSGWSGCTPSTCGTTGQETRTCIAPAQNGGRSCDLGPADGAGASRSCTNPACPVVVVPPPVVPPVVPPPVVPPPVIPPVVPPVANATKFATTAFLTGIGIPSGTFDPKHPTRPVAITILNSSNQIVATKAGTLTYDQAKGNFTSTVDAGTDLVAGSYILKIWTPQFLQKRIPGIITITPSTTITLPDQTLITGDANADNILNILDYNIIMDCYGNKVSSGKCKAHPQFPGNTGPLADINDDGVVDGIDYNLFLRSLGTQQGD